MNHAFIAKCTLDVERHSLKKIIADDFRKLQLGSRRRKGRPHCEAFPRVVIFWVSVMLNKDDDFRNETTFTNRKILPTYLSTKQWISRLNNKG